MELALVFAFAPKTHDCGANYRKFCKTFEKEPSAEGQLIFCENLDYFFNTTLVECPKCEITSVFDREITSLVGNLDVGQEFGPVGRNSDFCQEYYCYANDPFPALAELPAEVDLRVLGLVTESSDQLKCGSCWSFGEAAVIENAILLDQEKISSETFKQNARSIDISENFLLRNTYGGQQYCSGGNAETALQYALDQKWKTFEIEENYPYDNGLSQKYWEKKELAPVKIREEDWYFPLKILENNTLTVSLNTGTIEENVKEYLSRGIAVLATINTEVTSSSARILSSYSGYWPLPHIPCTGNVDHEVLFIGFGKFKGKNVWLMKNSWGKDFGNKGSFYIERGKNSWCVEEYAFAAIPLKYNSADGVFSKEFVSAYSGIKPGMLGFDNEDGSYTDMDKYMRNKLLYILAGCVGGLIIVGIIIWLSCKYCPKRQDRRTNSIIEIENSLSTNTVQPASSPQPQSFKGKPRTL